MNRILKWSCLSFDVLKLIVLPLKFNVYLRNNKFHPQCNVDIYTEFYAKSEFNTSAPVATFSFLRSLFLVFCFCPVLFLGMSFDVL